MGKLQAKQLNGKDRCQARVSYGSAWTAGRKQCERTAVAGEVFCSAHIKKWKRP